MRERVDMFERGACLVWADKRRGSGSRAPQRICVVSTRPCLSALRGSVLTSPSEGTLHSCGHYIITKKLRKDDCNSKFCIFSARHPPTDCPSCPHCTRVCLPLLVCPPLTPPSI